MAAVPSIPADLSCRCQTGTERGLSKATNASISACTNHQRRMLVLCLGGIGDTVLSFAALRDLRRACPHDHMTALAMWEQSAELLRDLGLFDEVLQHHYQRERLWRSLWFTSKQRRIRHHVSLLVFPANRFEYNALSWLLGARKRLGHSYLRGRNFANLRFLLHGKVAQQRGRHNVDENRALVASFTGITPNQTPDIRLGPLDPIYHDDAARILKHLREPLVGIHAGSSTFKGLETKRWPAQSFGELCVRLREGLGCQPIIFGAPDEIRIKLHIQSVCPEVFFAHGETIRHTAALIQRCTAFVSNDSALAHIASALDVPVVMVCGPTDPAEVGPYGQHGVALSAGLGCSPCFRVGRRPMCCVNPQYQACLKQVSVESVFEVVQSMLRRPVVPELNQSTYRLPVLVGAD